MPIIELKGLTKAFRTVIANSDIHLKVRKGTIHGIIGENGAGKSTTMKMLYGQYAPDSGEIWVGKTHRKWRTPADAIQAGIGMVHQHFMLAGPYSVLDNIILGAEKASLFGMIDRKKAREKLESIQKQYGFEVSLDARVESLSVGVQQRVEILKLLYRDARILILDEPTAVLTPQETIELFENLRRMKNEGKTILIITHKLKEVMAITDEITVFRGGKVAGHTETSKTSVEQLAEWMVGRKVLLQVDIPAQNLRPETALEVTGLCGAGRLKDVSFQVRSGEIVGIAGVEGNGQSELLKALLMPSDKKFRKSGDIKMFGEELNSIPTRNLRQMGLGVIAEDRHKEAVLLERPLYENYVLGYQRFSRNSNKGLMKWKSIQEQTARALEEYDVRPRVIDVEIGRLSGGNQQKLVVAREMSYEPKFFIVAQPTRGVDVGAIELIHRKIVSARDRGAGVLLVSSELDEILSLSDRILVMYSGRIVGEYLRGQASERELGLKMGGMA